MKNKELMIIAGPCSVDEKNLHEIYEISKIEANGKKAIGGTRVVGLKSRTGLDSSGDGMGMDYKAFMNNLEILNNGGGSKDFEELPSVNLAQEIHDATGMLISTEIMIPSVQLPAFDGKLNGKLMPWNPSVNQLGWTSMQVGQYAQKNNWVVGIKNGKWVGEDIEKLEAGDYNGGSPLEKTWAGVADYVGVYTKDIVLIHRGVDVPEKKQFRNAIVHNAAKRVKVNTGAKLYFDPSHSYGPKMKEDIVEATINAMSMTIDDENYLYDGILIEAGTSKTDTEQHISIDELKGMVDKLGEFRELVS